MMQSVSFHSHFGQIFNFLSELSRSFWVILMGIFFSIFFHFLFLCYRSKRRTDKLIKSSCCSYLSYSNKYMHTQCRNVNIHGLTTRIYECLSTNVMYHLSVCLQDIKDQEFVCQHVFTTHISNILPK